LELSMSILLTDTLSIPPAQAAEPATPLHQSSSGTPAAIRQPAWLSWLDRPLRRIALREIADDPHLLSDLGLTREEALREAAKPFGAENKTKEEKNGCPIRSSTAFHEAPLSTSSG
jgi:uncharacterized protein YjiS (DUF1127 family)